MKTNTTKPVYETTKPVYETTKPVYETTARQAYSYIRFSTPEQQMGDSERRQLALAKAYCEQHGLALADTAADKGVSGYRGRNHSNGALGRLLKQMQPGEILLVEDCDRWSREDPIDALTRLREEVRRGIEVVFLRTGTRVTAENFSDISVLVPNFFGALLGNGESVKKAERIRESWGQKYARVKQGKPARINRLPCWLKWDEEQDKPVVVESKAAVIRQMYELAAQGHGILEITQAMANTPPLTIPRRKNAKLKAQWNPTTVRSILTNRATLGYCTSVEPAAPGVWPAIVDEATFARAQSKLNIQAADKRPGHKSERNLLTGLAKCGCCGEHNLILHSSDKHNDDSRLVCQGAGAGRSNCGFAGVPYTLVEKSLLSFLADADLIRPLLADKEQKPDRLDELQARLGEADKQAKKLIELICDDSQPSPLLYARVKEEEAKAKNLRLEIEREQLKVKGQEPALLDFNEFAGALPAMATDPSRRPELRRAVRSVVESITLDPRGEKVSKPERGAHGHYLPRNGSWVYTVKLKGASETVEILCDSKTQGWCHRSLRPAQYAPVNGNSIG